MRKIKVAVLICMIAAFALAVGCGESSEFANQSIKQLDNSLGSADESDDYSPSGDGEIEAPVLGAWVTYWKEEEARERVSSLGKELDSICFFAAYFDVNETPFIPDATTAYHDELFNNGELKEKDAYLTFVNDLLLEKGSSLKDTELLERLFANDETIESHVNQIVQMTIDGGYDGIEIDYEAIKKNNKLWERFVTFENRLLEVASENNLKVRVILEPSAPIGTIDFPDGPEYVMMCYNLYGYGTKPGPKADKEFLIKMADKMEMLPGTLNFALATGGFDFCDDSVKQVSSKEAEELSKLYDTTVSRDEKSSALSFDYNSDDGKTHTVWYADNTTINDWMTVLKDQGHYRFTIW